MKSIAKIVAATVGALSLLAIAALFLVMAGEGYPTLAGIRNIFIRDGQIRIELPEDYTISKVRFEGEGPHSTAVSGNTATIRVGYTRAVIDLSFSANERNGRLQFGDVPKLNNWNRLVFRAESDPDGRLSFQINENGVFRDPENYHIKQTAFPNSGE